MWLMTCGCWSHCRRRRRGRGRNGRGGGSVRPTTVRHRLARPAEPLGAGREYLPARRATLRRLAAPHCSVLLRFRIVHGQMQAGLMLAVVWRVDGGWFELGCGFLPREAAGSDVAGKDAAGATGDFKTGRRWFGKRGGSWWWWGAGGFLASEGSALGSARARPPPSHRGL